jgi:hypothetical protein
MRYAVLFFLFALAALALFWAAGRGTSPVPSPLETRAEGATTFYIDALDGDDRGDGRTEATAWKSLGHLLRAHQPPGSQVLLRRGGVWRESLILDSSGTAGAPLLIGAYGEGAPPSVRGSDAFGAPGQWRYEDDGLWYLDDIRSDPGVFFHDDKAAARRKNKDDLADPWDFWYDGATRRLYVRLDTNPAAMAQSIEVPVRDFVAGPRDTSHVRLEGIDFRHAVKTTLLLWEADHVEIVGCAFTQTAGTHCQIGQGSNYTRITACTFDDWNMAHGRGYAIQAVEADSGPADVEQCRFSATHRGAGEDHSAIRSDDKAWIRTVRKCQFLGGDGALAGDGVSVWRPSAAASSLVIEDNLFQGIGGRAIMLEELENYGGALAVTVQRNRIDGACLRDEVRHDAIQASRFPGGLATVLVACNVITGTFLGQHPHGGIGIQETRGVRIVHNAVRGADDGIVVGFGASATLVSNNLLVGNRAVGVRNETGDSSFLNNAFFENGGGPVSGLDLAEGDVKVDPMVDSDLRPQAGSPCIDAGAETGLVIDFDQKRMPAGKGPDIGPYEVSPAVP